jgi:Transcriptional regulator PadR-like family
MTTTTAPKARRPLPTLMRTVAMAPHKIFALKLLSEHAEGMFPSQVVTQSGGVISRGSVYTLLDRLSTDGFVTVETVEPTDELQIRRSRFSISVNGKRALTTYAEVMGVEWKKPVRRHRPTSILAPAT